jgi:hypothetical protein
VQGFGQNPKPVIPDYWFEGSPPKPVIPDYWFERAPPNQ